MPVTLQYKIRMFSNIEIGYAYVQHGICCLQKLLPAKTGTRIPRVVLIYLKTHERRHMRYCVFKIADLKTSQTINASTHQQRQKLVTHDDIDSRDINPTEPDKVANKDSYDTCSRQLRMTCAGD